MRCAKITSALSGRPLPSLLSLLVRGDQAVTWQKPRRIVLTSDICVRDSEGTIMAKAPGEYQKTYRQRQKEKLRLEDDASLQFLRRPIGDYVDEASLDFMGRLDAFGVSVAATDWAELMQRFQTSEGEATMTALQRFEGLAGAFQDAAVELHTFINSYKIREVERVRDVLAAAKYNSPEAQKGGDRKAREDERGDPRLVEAASRLPSSHENERRVARQPPQPRRGYQRSKQRYQQ
jgi:hypothetical protein